MESGDTILHVCNVGNPPVSPLHCFASHSTLFQWKSLFSSQLSSAVLKVWGSCLAGVWVVFSLRQMPRYPLFYPPTLTLKHASFLRLRSVSFPQVNFCCTFPFVSAPSPSSPPPPLPLCPRCSPRVVNLLSAGSMNRTGLELRPTHLPTIACALCMAPACQNHLSSISSITAAPVLLFPPSNYLKVWENYTPYNTFSNSLQFKGIILQCSNMCEQISQWIHSVCLNAGVSGVCM